MSAAYPAKIKRDHGDRWLELRLGEVPVLGVPRAAVVWLVGGLSVLVLGAILTDMRPEHFSWVSLAVVPALGGVAGYLGQRTTPEAVLRLDRRTGRYEWHRVGADDQEEGPLFSITDVKATRTDDGWSLVLTRNTGPALVCAWAQDDGAPASRMEALAKELKAFLGLSGA